MSVPLMFFVAAWSYALCVNFVPSYRDSSDKFLTTEIGIEGAGSGAVGDEESGVGSGVEKRGVVEQENVEDHVDRSPEVKIG